MNSKKKLILAIMASMPSFSSVAIGSSILAYDSVFARYNRPDYDLVLGEYCYERVKHKLSREEITYQVKKNKLKGYYYKSKRAKGLVVIVHGMHAGGDDFLPMINYLVKHNFNVFSYDCSGTYDSEGESTTGVCQSLIDLEGTINFIKNDEKFNKLPLFLIGHSWGGYAATSVLELCDNIKACASIAGINSGATLLVDTAEIHAGKIGTVPGPIFAAYQKLLFGKYVDYSGVRGINSVNIPVLVAHGVSDESVSFENHSIYAKRNEITNPNVSYYLGIGLNSNHNNIWHSKAAASYQLDIESQLKLLKYHKGKDLTAEDKKEFYKTVDHSLYSEVNEELMEQILKLFKSTL